MRLKKIAILAAAFVMAITVFGCHAQVPPTNHTVTLTWTAPTTGCSSGTPCSYVLSRATIAAGGTCPTTSGTSYTPLNQSSPSTSTTYSDTTASGLVVCYIAQTEQGTAVSVPSNVAGPFTVPANPVAPALSGNEAKAEPQLPLPVPTLAFSPVHLGILR